jgi:pimeloyl-ACP methyl ester carboxylesterase
MNEQHIRVNGVGVHYYDAGTPDNPAILLLHGYLGDAWTHWQDVIPALQEDYYLIAPNLPAYGQSDKLQSLTMPNLIQWCADFLDALHINNAAIIGSSFGGGLLARLFAANHPKHVPAVILVNGGMIPTVPPIARTLANLPIIGNFIYGRIGASQVSRATLAALFEDPQHLTESFITRVQAQKGAVSQYMKAFTLMPSPEKRNPPIPILLIWGEEDTLTPRIVAEGMNQHMAGSHLQLIAGARHLPHVEATDVFIWQIRQFLDKITR